MRSLKVPGRQVAVTVGALAIFGLIGLAACGGSGEGGGGPTSTFNPVPTSLALASTNPSTVAGGDTAAVVATVLDQAGQPVAGATLTYRVLEGRTALVGGGPLPQNIGQQDIRGTDSLEAKSGAAVRLAGLHAGLSKVVVEYGALFQDTVRLQVTTPASALKITLTFDSTVADTIRSAMRWASQRWQQVILSGLPSSQVQASATSTCPAYNGVIDGLAVFVSTPSTYIFSTTVCATHPDGTPALVAITLSPGMTSFRDQRAFSLAQLGEALGFRTSYPPFAKYVTTDASGNSWFQGPKALAAYQALGGTAGPLGLAISNGAYWAQTDISYEVMDQTANMRVSPVTVAALADCGYTVNPYGTDPYRLGSVFWDGPFLLGPDY